MTSLVVVDANVYFRRIPRNPAWFCVLARSWFFRFFAVRRFPSPTFLLLLFRLSPSSSFITRSTTPMAATRVPETAIQDLFPEVKSGYLPRVRLLLRKYPLLDINYQDQDGHSPLHQASHFGHDAIVELLLSHPDIRVNLKSKNQRTPLHLACTSNRVACARLFLRDFRVDLTETDHAGHTPLHDAAERGSIHIIRLSIASGRLLNLEQGPPLTDIILSAQLKGRNDIVDLLRKFRGAPGQTRQLVMLELGLSGMWRFWWCDLLIVEKFPTFCRVSDRYSLLQ